MSHTSYIKCLKCNTKNQDTDYCINCGEIINIVLKRQIENEQRLKKKLDQQKEEKPNAIDVFFKKSLESPNGIIRSTAKVLQSIWTFAAMVVGALIAMVIGVAAG